jgi:hypothetical protein
MNIPGRLERLERSIPSADIIDGVGACNHPRESFHFYRVFAPLGYRSRGLITKGHCDHCGFDDYLWADYRLTEDHERRRDDLKSDYREAWAYDLELINAGLIDYVPFPPPLAVQTQYTVRIIQ